jgi:hypothetical protein
VDHDPELWAVLVLPPVSGQDQIHELLGLLGGQVGRAAVPFLVPVKYGAPQDEPLAVRVERLDNAGPKRRSLSERSVEAKIVNAFQSSPSRSASERERWDTPLVEGSSDGSGPPPPSPRALSGFYGRIHRIRRSLPTSCVRATSERRSMWTFVQ